MINVANMNVFRSKNVLLLQLTMKYEKYKSQIGK